MMKKLLLADDSITIQKVVGIIFSTEEYQLEMTDDGDSAFQKALADRPDLVIADISMPGKDGFELCRAIKSEPSLSGTSVLLLPGAFDHFDEAKAAEVCADGWLTKPFESQALLDKVAQLLDAEPLRMAGVAASAPEDVEDTPAAGENFVEDAAPAAESTINDSVLGLDEVEETAPQEEVDEESPDDIWDAVSFAEDELQQDAEDVGSTVAVAADVFGEETSVENSAPDFAATEIEKPAAPTIIEDEPAFVEETLEPEVAPVAELEVESFISTNEVSPVAVEESIDESTSEPDDVDFSAFTEGPEDFSAPSDSFVDDASPFIADVADDEPLDLVDSVEESVEVSAAPNTAADTETEEFATDAPLELDDAAVTGSEAVVGEAVTFVDSPVEEEALELSTEDEVSEFVVAEEPAPSVSEGVEEVTLDLTEEDEVEVEKPEPFVPAEEVFVPETDVVVDTVVEEVVEEPEEEILDLSVDEIVELEEDEVVEEEPHLADGESEVLGAEDVTELAEVVADDDIESSEDAAVVEEDGVEPLEEVEEIVSLEEVDDVDESEPMLTAEADEEEFFFDEPEDEVVEPAAVEVAAAAGVAAVVAETIQDDEVVESSATEQVEQQLRELSEDELKEVVANVAGPMIEKLAGEMLEQIAWEVVPDLAEAMINEEIRKIKEGAE